MERAVIEAEGRKAREAKEATATQVAKFDSAMEAKEENEKVLKEIYAQIRISETIDIEGQNMFDPEDLQKSSLLTRYPPHISCLCYQFGSSAVEHR
ncbi:hypothetical protein C0995_005214 [Termitomyces sp. Mi166|nr:hypothetical protein C0995_005214 [Termitomyces sp. Mi166\